MPGEGEKHWQAVQAGRCKREKGLLDPWRQKHWAQDKGRAVAIKAGQLETWRILQADKNQKARNQGIVPRNEEILASA